MVLDSLGVTDFGNMCQDADRICILWQLLPGAVTYQWSFTMVRNNVNIYFYYNIVNCADNVCTNICNVCKQCNVALKISQTNVIFIYFFKKQRWHSCQPFASNTTFIEAVQKVHWWCQKVSKAVQEISPRDFECSSSCSRTQDGPEIVKATNGALANDQTGSYT